MNNALKEKLGTKGLATLGLIFITFLAAIQYVFLNNVPDDLSSFSFVCITNLIGILVLLCFKAKPILSVSRKTLRKGVFFAVLLTGFNVFVLLGSQDMDPVVISSVVSLYFIFITPLLLLIRRKINFMSGIATVMAIIALLLMFGGDAEALFHSRKVIYLLIADVLFAAYVVSVSVLGSDEDSVQLTFSQMLFSVIFSLAGWGIEAALGKATLAIPTDIRFWVSALFIGVFIRAVYGLLQIGCQKHVSALSASLIFSMEIIITMLMNPVMSRLMGTDYVPANIYQIIGAALLIIATLSVDDGFMEKLGYVDMGENTVAKKMIRNTLTFSLVTLILATIISLSAIYLIRDSAVSGSTQLGVNASEISAQAMTEELERNTLRQVEDKAKLAEQKLGTYANAIEYAASYAQSLYERADAFPKRELELAKAENAGIWTMQLGFENRSVDYASLRSESELLGNMEDVFAPIVQNNRSILTIYMGTETGLIVSYDPDSQLAAGEGNEYYDFWSSLWYKLGRAEGKCVFTDTYWDGYGRGLTITCVAPFYRPDGSFAGCVAMDVLMSELNRAMVNDGIVDPTVATLIDDDGSVIASRDLDVNAQQSYNIFDEDREGILKEVGHEILERKDGILSTKTADDEIYVAFGTIDSTDWTLCIISPVSSVIAPAVAIRDNIDANTSSVVDSVLMGVLRVIQNLLALTGMILFILMLTAGYFSRKISDPLKTLTTDVMEISSGNLDRRTSVSTDDEIGRLAESFNVMTDSLQQYITDLQEVTAKEQRIAGELNAAAKIQASMLPRDFAEFCEGRPFTLYAYMQPAKEVGGDFYDYFMIDKDHLGLVMADVSGKGIPAALFMVVTKTLIKNHAQMGEYSPAKVLMRVNEQLCEGNEEELFVTVWFAILEISSGKGVAANAGHEHPALRRADGSYELLRYRHSPAVAALEGVQIQEHEFQLYPGDSLFVYTDGVPEATDKDNELFGDERMLAALNRDPSAPPEKLLDTVRQAMEDFVGDAPQFDDITMLGFSYRGVEDRD